MTRVGAAEKAAIERLGVRVIDASDTGWGIINHDLFLSNEEVQRVIRRSIDAAATCDEPPIFLFWRAVGFPRRPFDSFAVKDNNLVSAIRASRFSLGRVYRRGNQTKLGIEDICCEVVWMRAQSPIATTPN
jgi:hypothetical protein